jgi:TorA maturation chaperone TorD
MSGLVSGELPAAPDAGRKIFEKHMAPWIGRFFADLERVQRSDFYRRVGTVGRLFVEIETNAFALPESTHAETA